VPPSDSDAQIPGRAGSPLNRLNDRGAGCRDRPNGIKTAGRPVIYDDNLETSALERLPLK